jgi:hypothetical protein
MSNPNEPSFEVINSFDDAYNAWSTKVQEYAEGAKSKEKESEIKAAYDALYKIYQPWEGVKATEDYQKVSLEFFHDLHAKAKEETEAITIA